MRLAIVSPFPPEISGIGQYGARLSAGLACSRRFSEVRVFANRAAGAPTFEERSGLAVERAWQRDRFPASIASSILRWRPDVVWFNIGLSMFGRSRAQNLVGLALPTLIQRAGVPSVVTLHEIFEAANLRALGAVNGRLTKWGGRAATRMLLQADTVCLTMQAYVRLIQRYYGSGNLAYVPHGAFDPPGFARLSGEKRILIFATYAPYKGLPELIEIFRKLRAADPAVALTVAGSDHPRFPGYLAGVRAQTGDLPGLSWRVAPPEEELPEVFASARVVALPCRATTGASSVAHRAAAHGRPIIAYDLPDLRNVMSEERMRIEFVPPGDSAAFAARLRDLLDDPAQCESIGRANVAVMRTMTLDIICRRYTQLFEAAVRRLRYRGAAASSTAK